MPYQNLNQTIEEEKLIPENEVEDEDFFYPDEF